MSTLGFNAEDPGLHRLLELAVAEDVGSGDLTSAFTVAETLRGRGRIVARESLVVCGLVLFAPLTEALAGFGRAGAGAAELLLNEALADGATAAAGDEVCVIEGPARAILTLERTYLNFLGHLSGIATETARFVAATRAAGAGTRILDTRKTTPGMRMLEKYAVRCGGGANHRMGLFDAVLIKDNHVIAAGGIEAAVKAALEGAAGGVEVEVECDTMEQVGQALAAGATAILLDNFSPALVAEAVALVGGRARIEVSGGVNLDTVADYARAGADDISIGRLTHSARCADLSMEVSLLI